jgi:hypothetical protein
MNSISQELLEIQHNIWTMLDEYNTSKIKNDTQMAEECKVIQFPNSELNNQIQISFSYEERE